MSARKSEDTKISLSGYNRGNEDDPKNCNGGPSGTSCSSCDDRGTGPDKGLQNNVYPTVET